MQDIKKLAGEFTACQKILLALGDENRQHLILEMMQMGECDGVRVGAITNKTNLSRPAVSHPVKVFASGFATLDCLLPICCAAAKASMDKPCLPTIHFLLLTRR